MDTKIIRAASYVAVALAASFASTQLYSSAHATPDAGAPTPQQVDALLITDAGAPQEPLSPNATISFVTTPSVAANVFWGKKLLGRILPGKGLVVVRPRDSGPMDVVVRAVGYLPVQTRAHTFSDARVLVKLTAVGMESELLGYRAPLEAGVGDAGPTLEAGAADAGVRDASVFVDANYYPPVAPPPSPLFR